jgi:hypothetical protein
MSTVRPSGSTEGMAKYHDVGKAWESHLALLVSSVYLLQPRFFKCMLCLFVIFFR